MTDPIVLATDGSEIAEHATDAAAWMALALGVSVQVVNVTDLRSYRHALAAVDRDTDEYREAMRDSGQEALDRAVARLDELGVSVKTELLEGSPSTALVEAADAAGAWALVMGTHGRGALERAILGSVADRVVRTATVPTLTVREPIRDPRELPEVLLVPSDGSEAALAAGSRAVEWAQATGARLDLLHVIPPGLEGGPYLASSHELEDLHADLTQEALDPIAEQAAQAGVENRRLTAHAGVHEVILDRVENHEADAVVMGTQGRSGLQRFLLGSHADKVIRRSPVPVLTVRGLDR